MKTLSIVFGIILGLLAVPSVGTAYSNSKLTIDNQQNSAKTDKNYLAIPEGGKQALIKHIGKTLQWPAQYPDLVGKVFLSFDVDVISGEVSEIKVLKRTSFNSNFQQEAIRLLKTGPKWEVISKINSGKMPAKVSKIIMIKFDGISGTIGIGGI